MLCRRRRSSLSDNPEHATFTGDALAITGEQKLNRLYTTVVWLHIKNTPELLAALSLLQLALRSAAKAVRRVRLVLSWQDRHNATLFTGNMIFLAVACLIFSARVLFAILASIVLLAWSHPGKRLIRIISALMKYFFRAQMRKNENALAYLVRLCPDAQGSSYSVAIPSGKHTLGSIQRLRRFV